MLLNELLGNLKNKIKRDVEFGRSYAANVVDQEIERKKAAIDSGNGIPKDINKTKIALNNRLLGKSLTADDLNIFKILTKNKDEDIANAAIDTLRKLPLSSQNQRVLQNYLHSL